MRFLVMMDIAATSLAILFHKNPQAPFVSPLFTLLGAITNWRETLHETGRLRTARF